jgi:hypothetical protein
MYSPMNVYRLGCNKWNKKIKENVSENVSC